MRGEFTATALLFRLNPAWHQALNLVHVVATLMSILVVMAVVHIGGRLGFSNLIPFFL